MSYLSNKLVTLRKEKGYTQEKTAELLEVPHKRYASWEEGRAEPHTEMLLKISDFYGITVGELLRDEITKQHIMSKQAISALPIFSSNR